MRNFIYGPTYRVGLGEMLHTSGAMKSLVSSVLSKSVSFCLTLLGALVCLFGVKSRHRRKKIHERIRFFEACLVHALLFAFCWDKIPLIPDQADMGSWMTMTVGILISGKERAG